VRALVVVAGPGFFSTLGVPLRAGREFTLVDESAVSTAASGAAPLPPNALRVAIVGESFAQRYFGTTDVVGRRVKFG